MSLPCTLCQKLKSPYSCGLCADCFCKSCVEFLEEDQFLFSQKLTAKYKTQTFCKTCYLVTVEADISFYENMLTQAKNIFVFMKSQGKETRLIKRLEKPVEIINCADYDQALLTLAYGAAENNFNSIIDVNLVPKKIIDGSYQTTIWSGTAMPANVTDSKLIKDRSNWSNPN